MINLVDAIIILVLLMGAVIGFKKGVIKSVVSFFGMILVILLSITFKNPLATFLYTYFPFFNLGIDVLNILVYEGIAFLILFVLLSLILKVLVKISGLVEKVLDITVILAIPSKILGAIFGFLEYYLFVFIALFILVQFSFTSSFISDSKLADEILGETPFISEVATNTYSSVKELITLNQDYNPEEQAKFNQKALEILLKYKIVSVDNVERLMAKGKLENDEATKALLNKYREENKND